MGRAVHRALVSPAMPRTLKLAVVGTAAGAFSGLLGVGGGSVIVPLLIIWLGYGEREATGTSMMAIVVIAALAVSLQAGYGNVNPGNAALVGIPAVVGVVAGTAIQQRVPERAISLVFAALLAVIAIELIVS
ncbi:MAG TPA: sulfite exporter TauE/SafE family protein [Solirubrobacterales bacterium]